MANEPLKRVCFLLHVKPDRLEEYKRRHEDVWPEMREALHKAGWYNYSLFLRDDGLLVGYVETPDFARAIDKMAVTDVNSRWQSEMAEFFEAAPGSRADEQFTSLTEVFHLA